MTHSNTPRVSIVIPCRNEERNIGSCLDALIAQDYPKECLEVIVVDGSSEDHTRLIVFSYVQRFSYIRCISNSEKYTPISMNKGIRAATGDIIGVFGAHSKCDKQYISKCISVMQELHADAVGGSIETKPHSSGMAARAIALCLTSIMGTGGSAFRHSVMNVKEVDTFFNGFYRRELFKTVGLYNENLLRTQDMELHMRIKKQGKKMYIAPECSCAYYPKATFGAFLKHNIQDGIWAIYPLKFVRIPLRPRHYVPLLFVTTILFLMIGAFFSEVLALLFFTFLAFYAIAIMAVSICIAWKERDARLMPHIFSAFLARHFGYGIGSAMGCVKLFADRTPARAGEMRL